MCLIRLLVPGSSVSCCPAAAVIEAKDAENAVLRRSWTLRWSGTAAGAAVRSWNAGWARTARTPDADVEESIGAKERRKAGVGSGRIGARAAQGRKRGGQPGHQGKGLARDPDPGEMKEAGPRRNAAVAGLPWTAQRPRARVGRRSSTWK